MLLLLHLFVLLAFGALLVVNCGKNKKENTKKLEQTMKSNEEKPAQQSLNQKNVESNTDDGRNLLEESDISLFEYRVEWLTAMWARCKTYMDSCNDFDQFSLCDVVHRMKLSYNAIRARCHCYSNGWFNRTEKRTTNVKMWILLEEAVAINLYMPYFREMKKKFQEKHGEHLDQKGKDELLDFFNQIEKEFQLIVDAKKKYEKEGNVKDIEEDLNAIPNSLQDIKNLEPWMKPFGYDECHDKCGYLFRIFDRDGSSMVHGAWKDPKEFEEVIKTCRKKKDGGECDFMQRANFFIATWRRLVQDDPPSDRSKYWEKNLPDEDMLKFEVKYSDMYMKKVDEAKEEHRGHLKDPKEIDDWFQLHKNKTKEVKERYDAYVAKDEHWDNNEWRKVIGYKKLPVQNSWTVYSVVEKYLA